jgi:hypothetical protein
LVEGVRDFWAITDVSVVEKLVEDDEAGVSRVEEGEMELVDFGRVAGGVC